MWYELKEALQEPSMVEGCFGVQGCEVLLKMLALPCCLSKKGLRFRDLGFQKEKAFQWQYGSETAIVIDLYVSKKLAMPETLTPEAPKS